MTLDISSHRRSVRFVGRGNSLQRRHELNWNIHPGSTATCGRASVRQLSLQRSSHPSSASLPTSRSASATELTFAQLPIPALPFSHGPRIVAQLKRLRRERTEKSNGSNSTQFPG